MTAEDDIVAEAAAVSALDAHEAEHWRHPEDDGYEGEDEHGAAHDLMDPVNLAEHLSRLHPNIEPDLTAALLYEIGRRTGFSEGECRFRVEAARQGDPAGDVLLRQAIADGYDPEQIGYPSDELQAILEASPCFGKTAIEMADAGLIDMTHAEAVELERLSRWGAGGEPSDA